MQNIKDIINTISDSIVFFFVTLVFLITEFIESFIPKQRKITTYGIVIFKHIIYTVLPPYYSILTSLSGCGIIASLPVNFSNIALVGNLCTVLNLLDLVSIKNYKPISLKRLESII
uniref:Uncharacterized protein n=1 Tax=Babesia orientalis TaxID=273649 RepID=A0A0M3TGT4_9APIC|nr:hypothetical protein [Babesia orientalis]ALE29349.1 hypothetical protein [Babesia orientalis]